MICDIPSFLCRIRCRCNSLRPDRCLPGHVPLPLQLVAPAFFSFALSRARTRHAEDSRLLRSLPFPPPRAASLTGTDTLTLSFFLVVQVSLLRPPGPGRLGTARVRGKETAVSFSLCDQSLGIHTRLRIASVTFSTSYTPLPISPRPTVRNLARADASSVISNPVLTHCLVSFFSFFLPRRLPPGSGHRQCPSLFFFQAKKEPGAPRHTNRKLSDDSLPGPRPLLILLFYLPSRGPPSMADQAS